MATAVDTVSVSREAILDAIGWLMAADDLFIALNDDTDSSPGVLFTSAGFDLKIAAFGENPEGEDEYERDPDHRRDVGSRLRARCRSHSRARGDT